METGAIIALITSGTATLGLVINTFFDMKGLKSSNKRIEDKQDELISNQNIQGVAIEHLKTNQGDIQKDVSELQEHRIKDRTDIEYIKTFLKI